jgi:hypothetical protein
MKIQKTQVTNREHGLLMEETMKSTRFIIMGMAALMLMLAGCDREITGDGDGLADNSDPNCLVCHSGLLDQAQGEWANSIHASGNSIDYTNRAGRDCMMCHDQEGFLFFLEFDSLPDTAFEGVSAIGCFSCHNPHETGTLELREPGPYTLDNGVVFDRGAGNLCANCHHSRGSIDDITDNYEVTSSRWGPHHGPQSDMIEGTNMWEFPGEGYAISSSPHRSEVRDACAGCHMGDERTHLGYGVGGHSFNMEDAASGENMAGFCEDCHPEVDGEFDFVGIDSLDYDNDGVIEGYMTEVDGLIDSLHTLLLGQGLITSSGSRVTGIIADQHVAGAVWNYAFIKEDKSRGIHNFNYVRSALDASIDYVTNLGGGAPPGTMAALPSH